LLYFISYILLHNFKHISLEPFWISHLLYFTFEFLGQVLYLEFWIYICYPIFIFLLYSHDEHESYKDRFLAFRKPSLYFFFERKCLDFFLYQL